MKKLYIIAIAAISALWACEVLPAEEPIANTGAANFSASFECPVGMAALWDEGDKLLVIDTKNTLHRFDMDAGSGKSDGEFSGTLSEDSQIKYVAYSHNVNEIVYDAALNDFTMKVPSVHTAKDAGYLVKTNTAAIGILQGSEVSLQSLCGFVKFSLEPNGETLEQDGKVYNLTDLRKISFTSNDGTALAGTIHATWDEGAPTPTFLSVEEGGDATIVFNTRQITTPDGEIFYEAGDYYIPVVPRNFEDVTIVVEDYEGHKATAVAHRAINVQAAMQSNLNSITWPTIEIYVNLQCSSKAEEQTHAELTVLPTNGLAVDRKDNTTGEVFAHDPASPKQVEYVFHEAGLEHSLWTSEGVGRWTAAAATGGGYCMADLCFCFYNANWTYSGQPGRQFTTGAQQSQSWIRLPEYNGILVKVEVNVYVSSAIGAMSLSSKVKENGIGDHKFGYFATVPGAKGSFGWVTFPVAGAQKDDRPYICMESGNTWRIRGWKLHYKVFE